MWTDLDKNRIVASSHIWGNARINILWIPLTFIKYIGNLENQVCFMIFGFCIRESGNLLQQHYIRDWVAVVRLRPVHFFLIRSLSKAHGLYLVVQAGLLS